MKKREREREEQWKPTKSWRVLTEDSHICSRIGKEEAKEKKAEKLISITGKEKEGR